VSAEVIQRLVAVEAEARVLVRDGELAAGRVIAGAQEEARRRVACSRAEARRVGSSVLEGGVAEARAEAERLERAGVAAYELRLVVGEGRRVELLEALVACVIGEEGGG
jgi:vacuolar-type H+-ATPase subunit H